MSTVKTKKNQEIGNILSLILAFIPIANCFAFFYMAGKVPSKKWSALGWMTIIVNIILVVALIMLPLMQNPYYDEYSAATPNVIEYCGSSYYLNPDYESTPEYKEFEEAKLEWEKSDEAKQLRLAKENWNNRKYEIIYIAAAVFAVFNVLIFVLAIVERPKFLRMLKAENNKTRMSEHFQSQNMYSPANAVQEAKPLQQLDINTATEEQLTALPGLTVIDAKKAISYIEQNGKFNSLDEFFTCINAKPHIIAKLQGQLFIEIQPTGEKSNNSASTTRKIDI